jgi:hypothetical protein
MSADLFAEFASDTNSVQGQQLEGTAKPSSVPPPNFSFFDNLDTTPSPVIHVQPLPPQQQQQRQHQQQQQLQNFAPIDPVVLSNDDNDDWGDFEGGSSIVAPSAQGNQDSIGLASTIVTRPSQSSNAFTPVTQDPFAFDLGPSKSPIENSWQRAPIVKAKRSADPSVLFDAEDNLDDNDDDDFGDFEGTDTKPHASEPVVSSSALVDLLGDLNVSQPMPLSSNKREHVVEDRHLKNSATSKKSPVKGFGTASKPKQVTAKLTPTVPKEDDAWDTFDDWEASIPTKAVANSSSKRASVAATVDAISSTTPTPILSPVTEDAQPGELPPTNVPPPGVLLSLFPSLFADAQEKLFKPMAAQTLPMRNKLMAEPATIAYLQGYLMLGNVAAHIIAGRKLRWKRDQHLSQGMRIGPASSRATSGMKLTGIDKGENMKEERETSDVVRVWKDQVGRLRHVVAGVNQIKAGTLGGCQIYTKRCL